MKVLDQKLVREIQQSKGLLAAILAITTVGTACFVGMLSTFENLRMARSDYYSRCRMADFWLDLKKAPLAEVSRLLDVPGVAEVRPRIVFPVVVDLEGVDKLISGRVISMPRDPTPVLNNILLQRGSYFTPDRRNEVILSEKFAKARHISPGMFIHMLLNEQRKELFVVGTAISCEYMDITPPGSMVPEPENYGIFYVKQEFAEEAFGFQGACNDVIGILQPSAKENPEPVLAEMERRLDPYGVFAATPLKQQQSNLAISSELSGLEVMATMLPLVFLAVAALVLNVLMMRMAEQQRTIVGTLKALGYDNMQVFLHFLKFGLFVGVLGGVGGCALGYWLAGEMTGLYRFFYEFPRLENGFYPIVMALAVLISVFFATMGTLRGVQEVVKLSPAEAMRERPPASGGRILLEQWGWLWSRLDFRWQMVLRGVFRNKVRTLIGMIAAAAGSGLVVLALGNTDSLNYTVFFQFSKILVSDYDLTLKDEVDEGALDEAKRLPGVCHAEPVCLVACTFENGNHRRKGAITGIVPDARLTVPHDANAHPVRVPPVGLLMTRRLAQHLHVREGDRIRFTPVKGVRIACEAPVARIIDSIFGLCVYADYGYLNRLIGETSALSRVQLKAQQTPEERTAFLRELKSYPKLQAVAETASQKITMTRDFIAKLKTMSVVMIGFAGIIFFGSILNGSLISIAERRREIATFRVLGYHPGEVGAIFLRENLLINMTGALAGLPLGYWMLLGMMTMYTNDMYSMPCAVNPSSWVWTIALAVIFVLGAHLILQWTISRMEWGEALKMKE